MRRVALMASLLVVFLALPGVAAESKLGPFDQGVKLYNDGRKSEAMESFELAIRKKDRAKEANEYIDRIRKEAVQRIRDKNVTGVSKASWQTKYYYMNMVDNAVNVGVSVQEIFERDNVNFRPGALDALAQLAAAIAKADTKQVRIDLINEISQDLAVSKEVLAQQQAAVFSYLSLAARGQLPKY